MQQVLPPLEVNSEEIQEIITAVPSWILRWGMTLIFAVLSGILLLSSIIEYPDVVKTNLKVNSLNSPKSVLAKQNGKLVALLVQDGQMVKQYQLLAYLESTANPEDILKINKQLKNLKSAILRNVAVPETLPTGLNLGELQGSYQNFFQQYIQYQATQEKGYYLARMAYLKKDIHDIHALKQQILEQEKIQKLEIANQEQEYAAYQKLYKNKVISRSEFAQQENKYLASKYPLQQSATSLINNSGNLSSKEKELLEIRHTISEQQSNFIQALNRCIMDSEDWMLKFVFRSPVAGRISFAGIIQQSQNITANQEVFIVNPGNIDFFGEIQISQYNMGKIRLHQRALVKLRSYPFEQYGMIRGKLTYISEVAYKDSVFIAKINFDQFENKDPNRKIILKNGMQAEAEIITEESSLLQRFFRNIIKILGN
jgi:multidrug efflux pump subunit AcrA (membrane-fusion protein)